MKKASNGRRISDLREGGPSDIEFMNDNEYEIEGWDVDLEEYSEYGPNIQEKYIEKEA